MEAVKMRTLTVAMIARATSSLLAESRRSG